MVIDDEQWAQKLISDYIIQTDSLDLCYSGNHPIAALEQLDKLQIELVFIDVEMPQLTGIEFIRQASPKVKFILVTAYPGYALDGYELNVVDYLLKPVSIERFNIAVAKYIQFKDLQIQPELLSSELAQGFFMKSGQKIHRVDFQDILYLEGLRDYVAVHTIHGKLLTYKPLKSFETLLPPNKFVRIHKSYIIPVSRINFLNSKSLILEEKEFPIGESYKTGLMKLLNPF